MKVRIFLLTTLIGAATCARAGTPAYVQCGTYDSYLLLYRSLEKFEELGKLRCSEKVEILARTPGYYQVRAEDGRIGWVLDADISLTPPPPHHPFTFGMIEPPKPAPVPVAKRQEPSGTLTNDDVIAAHKNPAALAVLVDKIKTTPSDFDTSPLAIRQLRSAEVPDKVILAMLAVPSVSSEPPMDPETTMALKVPTNTAMDFRVTRDVPSDGIQVGDVVELTADEDLVIHGQLIVEKGAQAKARVMGVRPPGSLSRPGEVAWFMQDISTVQGEVVPAIFSTKQPGKMHTKVLDGYPFFLSDFDKGEPAIHATKIKIRAVLVAGTILRIPQHEVPGSPLLQAKAQVEAPATKTAASAAATEAPSPVPAGGASTTAPTMAPEATASSAESASTTAVTPTAAPVPAAAHDKPAADPPPAAQSFTEPPSK
jgi:hypothetical protein